jgi:hypothetical protein
MEALLDKGHKGIVACVPVNSEGDPYEYYGALMYNRDLVSDEQAHEILKNEWIKVPIQ